MPRPQLPPYSLFLSLTWKQFLGRFDIILPVTLGLALPLYALVDVTLPRELIAQNVTGSVEELIGIISHPTYIVNVVLQVVVNVALVFIAIVIILTLQHAYHRQVITLHALVREAIRFYPRAIVLHSITGIITLIGLGLLLVPGIIVAVFFSMALPALVWDKLTIRAAMVASWRMVRGRWWSVCLYLTSTYVLTDVAGWLIITVLPNTVGFTTAGLTIAAIINVFAIIFTVVVFTGLVVKKPGLVR
ncbi:MAG: hypothetical protein HYV33_02670 [Candidatus Kerfeldbacteria bacterium]|nr:hypothetical protein [Candidatus Kerfeldbacteria bacterium]